MLGNCTAIVVFSLLMMIHLCKIKYLLSSKDLISLDVGKHVTCQHDGRNMPGFYLETSPPLFQNIF